MCVSSCFGSWKHVKRKTNRMYSVRFEFQKELYTFNSGTVQCWINSSDPVNQSSENLLKSFKLYFINIFTNMNHILFFRCIIRVIEPKLYKKNLDSVVKWELTKPDKEISPAVLRPRRDIYFISSSFLPRIANTSWMIDYQNVRHWNKKLKKVEKNLCLCSSSSSD